MCMWSVFPKRERQTSRHGPGLILMQPHGVGLRLRDNCCSEEWMAWELSSHTGASHQAVHHMGLTSDILRRETKAISSVCAQLMHKHTKLTSHNLVAYKVRHRHVYVNIILVFLSPSLPIIILHPLLLILCFLISLHTCCL